MAVSLSLLRRIFTTVALVTLIAVPGVLATTAPQAHPAVERQDCTVYVTKTGHKYHRAGCQYLKSSAIKMSRSEAIKAGYTACKRCGGSTCE